MTGGRDRTGAQQQADRSPTDTSTEQGRLAFIQVLNDRLPTKRLIAQGLLRSPDGRVLVCELVYKTDWDLPGGVVDPGESPAACVAREVREELALEVEVGPLLAVNWLPPYRGWDDALLCLFDLGTAPLDLVDGLHLQAREIKAARWASLEELGERAAPYTEAMVRQVLKTTGPALYLENSRGRT